MPRRLRRRRTCRAWMNPASIPVLAQMGFDARHIMMYPLLDHRHSAVALMLARTVQDSGPTLDACNLHANAGRPQPPHRRELCPNRLDGPRIYVSSGVVVQY